MNFTPDTGHKRSKRPRFGWEATVEVWAKTGPDCKPTATLHLAGWAWHRDQAYRDARFDARCALGNLQVPPEVIERTHLEVQVQAWYALDPKHVRNPEGLPVPAEYLYAGGEPERAALIKQQRLVPDDWEHSNALYLITKPQAVAA